MVFQPGKAAIDLPIDDGHRRARKKPVEVDVMLITRFNMGEVSKWCGFPIIWDRDGSGIFEIRIDTLEGAMHGQIGDYIIKGVAGEFYPCKPDIFNLTYDVIVDETGRVGVRDALPDFG